MNRFTLQRRERQLLDFDIETGTAVITLNDVAKAINYFPRLHPYRIYLLLLFTCGMRTKEPMEITWANLTKHMLIFRPEKTNGKRLRKVRIPPKVWEELIEYREKGFFPDGKLFGKTKSASYRQRIDKVFRHKFGGNWTLKSGNLRAGKVSEYYKYSMRCFRTTMATLVYYYYARVYGEGDVALCRTASYMAHSTHRMTANYYVQRINGLKIEMFPEFPLMQLIEHLTYGEVSLKVTDFLPEKERQGMILEY